MRCAIVEDALTFVRYYFDPKTKKRGTTLALCSSVVKFIFTTCGMIENIGDALDAVACSPTNQAINIALTDGVV